MIINYFKWTFTSKKRIATMPLDSTHEGFISLFSRSSTKDLHLYIKAFIESDDANNLFPEEVMPTVFLEWERPDFPDHLMYDLFNGKPFTEMF